MTRKSRTTKNIMTLQNDPSDVINFTISVLKHSGGGSCSLVPYSYDTGFSVVICVANLQNMIKCARKKNLYGSVNT